MQSLLHLELCGKSESNHNGREVDEVFNSGSAVGLSNSALSSKSLSIEWLKFKSYFKNSSKLLPCTPLQDSESKNIPIISKSCKKCVHRRCKTSSNLIQKGDDFAVERLSKPRLEVNSNFNENMKDHTKGNRYPKRELRGTFAGELTTESKFFGKLKNFSIKKRFGFIKIDQLGFTQKIFVCEDDLLISGINYKELKKNVHDKRLIFLSFKIKSHYHGKEKIQKAVEIEISPPLHS